MIECLIRKIAQHLDERKIPYMIIGGQAVLLYGRPRLTRDIDITLGVDTDEFASVEEVCRELKLRLLVENPQDFAQETKVLPAEEPDSKIRVDFIFSFTLYEAQAITNAKQVLIDDYPVKFASCEDVVIHKMVAGRAIDEEDVKAILAKNKGAIDLEHIEKWLLEFGKIPEQEGILEKFKRLLRS
ncbi:MAG TPA: nucleotidyl transferase AbiEii/AbiGii toxin family protein [Sedimentisphaerales bacterium]|jgi:predicted nucleotidyltransferase|nr:nucleotidyl transferase AbiEii/AbiGii toxin family protein [Sedimentisphaerales bacterium]